LASSSLKIFAIKFGFEKLSQLPNSIEDIAKHTIDQNLKIPAAILHKIAEAIFLLQTFADNSLYRTKFKHLFHELNQYRNTLMKGHEVTHI